MRIACISASRVPSNTANSIQLMKACQALSQLGHEVHLFVPETKESRQVSDFTAYYGLNTEFSIKWLASRDGWHRYDFAFHATRQARKLKADLVYVWFLQAGIIGLLASLPVLIEMHGPPEGRLGPSLFRLFLTIPGRKRLLPISQALALQLSKRYSIDRDKTGLVQISPNGVDLERFSDLPKPDEARARLGLPALPTVGYTGHLYPGRGMELLVQLARRFPQVSFIWVGGSDGDVKTWRERLVEEKLLNISLTGFVDNERLPLYQAAADILLMPYEKAISGSSGGNSASYASPMKMFEYMASRRPIISSDLPVIREILNPANAVLCPPDDAEAWTQAIRVLLGDIGKRSSLSDQAWQDVQGHTWQARARKALQGFPKADRAGDRD
jgi:glycosyltransferase involved in cell wall biosynthesis